MTYKLSLFSEKIEWNIRPNSVSKTKTWKLRLLKLHASFFRKLARTNLLPCEVSNMVENHDSNVKCGVNDFMIMLNIVQSNPCETIKPFSLEKCGTSNVKIILILLHVSIKPRYFFNSRVVHI